MDYSLLVEAALYAPTSVVLAVASLLQGDRVALRCLVHDPERAIQQLVAGHELEEGDARSLVRALAAKLPVVVEKAAPDPALVEQVTVRLEGGWTARTLAAALLEQGVVVGAATLHDLQAARPGVYPQILSAALHRVPEAFVPPHFREIHTLLTALRTVRSLEGLKAELQHGLPALQPFGQEAIAILGEDVLADWLARDMLPGIPEVQAASGDALGALRVLVRLVRPTPFLKSWLDGFAECCQQAPGAEERGVIAATLDRLLTWDVVTVQERLSGQSHHMTDLVPTLDVSGLRVLLVGGEGLSRAKVQAFEALSGASLTVVPVARHGSALRAVSAVGGSDVVMVRARAISHAASEAVEREALRLGVPLVWHNGGGNAERLLGDLRARLAAPMML